MDLDALIDIYCEAWNETDPARRRDKLETALVGDATYTDPTVRVVGHDALDQHIAGVLADRPGARIRHTSAVDRHHDVARFAWHMVKADGEAMPEGLDIVTVDPATGKLCSIVGFFGPIPRDG